MPTRSARLRPVRSAVALALAAAALGLALAALASRAAAAPAAESLAAYVRAHYTKREERIPMRDGARLYTAIYVPNESAPAAGAGAAGAARSYPILLNRTPYAVMPYGPDAYKPSLGPSPAFAKEGFIFAYQDVRGRFMSEGEFVQMRPEGAAGSGGVDESTDAYDTIDWLVRHVPGNNGRVGMWGISYGGFYAAAGAIHSHPALRAVSPQAPIADWFWDDFHRNGAFNLVMGFDFFSVVGRPRPGLTTARPVRFDHGTPDGYGFFLRMGPLAEANARYLHGEIPFWNQIVEHPNYDEFWRSRNILPHLRGVRAAVLNVGGWFDTEDLYGPLATYQAIERQNPGISNVLVMGPWFHGAWAVSDGRSLGGEDFGFATADYYRDQVELPFFRHYLEGEGELHPSEALVFETGAGRWRHFPSWPPPGLRREELYLRSGGRLSFQPPAAAPAAGDAGEASDAYVSDPAKPVPYTMTITNHWPHEYMTEDQRFAAWRPDVLAYTSEPLDADLTLAGPLAADLWVSTTGRDSDWIVKLIDVEPEDPPEFVTGRPTAPDPDLRGTERLVRAGVMRGRFRESFEHPIPFEPGEVAHVAFDLRDVFHTFRRGHRLMIQVQSTWFPLVDRNPQSWVENIYRAKAEDFVAVTNRVFRSPAHPSGLRVSILDAAASGPAREPAGGAKPRSHR